MNHGHHKDGTPVTDADVEAMADEAEQGYDVDTLLRRRRRGGRPPLGSAAASVESVRLDPSSSAPCWCAPPKSKSAFRKSSGAPSANTCGPANRAPCTGTTGK